MEDVSYTMYVTVMVPFQEPNKFGCSEGNVFDAETQVCKLAEEVRTCSLVSTSQPGNVDTKIITINYARCPSVRAGTVVPRTASAATTATQTALVEHQLPKI